MTLQMKIKYYPCLFGTNKAYNQFAGFIGQHYGLIPMGRREVTRSYYDSFDWRLYDRDRVFEINQASERRCVIRQRCEPGLYRSQELEDLPVFASDIPPGTVTDVLLGILGVRALIKLAEIKLIIESYEVRDKCGKILVRMDKERYLKAGQTGASRTVMVVCNIFPLKGYEKTGVSLWKSARNFLPKQNKITDPMDWVLKRQGLEVQNYSGKLNLQLKSDSSLGQAMVTTLLYLLDIMEKNINGIRADIDTEFLHDFRIASRRSRALITQVEGVFDSVEIKHFKRLFSELSLQTSELRDLDVFLLGIPHYQAILPDEQFQELEPLKQASQKKRVMTYERISQWVDSDGFKDWLSQWQTFLNKAADGDLFYEKGTLPVRQVASRVIWRNYRRLMKQGKAACKMENAALLHELRKTGKKLRYLLEAFRSLYEQDEIEHIIGQLRKLQDLLGEVIDSHVQQDYLLAWLGEQEESHFPETTNRAIATLAKKYKKMEIKSCAKFKGRFKTFSSRDNQHRFKKLFHGTES